MASRTYSLCWAEDVVTFTDVDVTIIVMGVVGVRWRKDVGVARDFFWVASFLVVAGLAYFIHHWRHLQLALALFTIPNLVVFL